MIQVWSESAAEHNYVCFPFEFAAGTAEAGRTGEEDVRSEKIKIRTESNRRGQSMANQNTKR